MIESGDKNPTLEPKPVAEGRLSVPRSPRYESLDVWRGIACLLVIVFHSTFYVATPENEIGLRSATLDRMVAAATARMWIGVPMFFVISGYCISASADSTRLKNQPTIAYFIRRLRRIYPPWWICVACCAILVEAVERFVWPGLFSDDNHGIVSPLSLSATNWFGNLTLTETWIYRLFHHRPRFFLGHAWTLCYEEQFYVVVGLTLLATRRYFFSVMAAITLFVLTLDLIRPDSGHGLFIDHRWFCFSAGILLYYNINYASRLAYASLCLLLLTGVIWSLRDPLKFASMDANRQQYACVAFAFTLVLHGLHRFDAKIAGSQTVRPIAICGAMCYSLYLVHLPVVKVISHGLFLTGVTSIWATMCITVPLCIGFSLICGWCFHVLVERRFLSSPGRVA